MDTIEQREVLVNPPLGQWLSGIGLPVLSVLAVLLGLAPVLVLAGRPWLWILTAAAAAALAVIHWLRNRGSFSGRPTLLRLPVTFIAAIYPSALCSAILLFCYWILSWLFRGVGALMGRLGWQLAASPATLGSAGHGRRQEYLLCRHLLGGPADEPGLGKRMAHACAPRRRRNRAGAGPGRVTN